MTAVRRLRKELADLQKTELKFFHFVAVDTDNLLSWSGLIVPNSPPYDRGAFLIEMEFPKEYPFRPPKLTFKTKIYHPNISEKGEVCLNLINPDMWKPTTRVEHILTGLIDLINHPEPEHPLRADVAEEYIKNRKKFLKNAEDFTINYSEERPLN